MREKYSKPVIAEITILLVFVLPLLASPWLYEFTGKLPIQTRPGYHLSVFASGNALYRSPDAIDVDQQKKHVFIDYPNITAKDGSDHKTSTIVEYNMNGKVLKQFSVSGHSDGMRVDPITHFIWVLSNEVSNPLLTIIDPASGNAQEYRFPPTAHGGGYDDLYFLNGFTYPFISAGNPKADKNGRNVNPSVYRITQLEPGHPGLAGVFPVLLGNASARDKFTKATHILNEIDPDALSQDLQGDLILVDQITSEIVFIAHPGTQQQEVRHLGVGTEIDDTVWIPQPPVHGRLLIADAARNQTYWMEATFKPGTVYTESYPDSSVQSVVAQLDPDTGVLTIVATGFLKPTGLLFVSD